LLGPMINIARVPQGGRNFESFGEDPYLAAELVKPEIQGIQSQGVIGCAKHYVCNNQEYHRTSVSANVDERTMFEIYLPAFKAAVDAGVGSIMCSYNKINSTWACENDVTLNNYLKQKLGFQGWVMSDWGATHTTAKAATGGLDQQMPDASYFGANLATAVNNGQVPQSRVDDMVVRMLTAMYAGGLFDNPQTGDLNVNVQSAEHTTLARTLAEAGTVLLKNTGGILPIDTTKVRKIAVIGDDGQDHVIATGGGSGGVVTPYVISPFQGIKTRAGASLNVTYINSKSTDAAAALARQVDVAIVFVATTSSEGGDRGSLSLPGNADALVSAVAAAQPKTVVVVHCPSAVLTPWSGSVAGVISAFLPGQEDGNAIANVLFGDVNPSGRMPVTFPVNAQQIPVNTPAQYPGINDQSEYSEKLLVGYRWYDARNVDPQWAFGHGLSYTTFEYSNLKVAGSAGAGFTVTADIKNTGGRAGAEVAQLYLGFPASAGEPPKLLKGFQKVNIQAGQAQTVTFKLGAADLSIWDVNKHDWALASGTFDVLVGASSRDIRVRGTLSA